MSIADELRRRGVAASTIREALGEHIAQEPLRIINKLCLAKTHDEMIDIQADARAYNKLRKELESAMDAGKE